MDRPLAVDTNAAFPDRRDLPCGPNVSGRIPFDQNQVSPHAGANSSGVLKTKDPGRDGSISTTIVGERGMIEVLGEGGGGLTFNGEPQHLVLHRDGKETLTFRFGEGEDDVWQSDVCYYSQGHINQIRKLR